VGQFEKVSLKRAGTPRQSRDLWRGIINDRANA
jgi:hypothetical protein